MKSAFLDLAFGIILLIQGAVAQPAPKSPVPPDSEIRKILVDPIDRDKQSVGIVVGLIESTGRRIIAYGSWAKDDKRPLNGDTIFEIGSVTKVFTSLLLADMVQRGEVALTDPVAKYLPPTVKMPERGRHSIALVDLSTHTSGLPRLPGNISMKDPANPYADYSVEQLYQFLSSYSLPRDPGEKFEYSNLGGGLLGHVLARRAGVDYEALIQSRIAGPLGMRSTRIALPPSLKERLAVGHDATLKAVPNWNLSTLAGAGALRSTANDMLNFLAANLGYMESPLAGAMASMTRTRRPMGTPGMEIGLGWLARTRDGNEIVWHSGGTGGFRSYVGYDPKRRVGVVVLSNAETPTGVDDIGMHLLDGQTPLMKAPSEHKEISLDPKLFDGYVGRYELAPSFIITVTREGNQLFLQATGQPRAEIFPESERDYFLKVVDAQITFEVDAQGKTTGLVLHQGGMNQPAKRIEGEASPVKEHKQVAVDPKLFDGYVGRYELVPSFVITVTRAGNQLFVQATG